MSTTLTMTEAEVERLQADYALQRAAERVLTRADYERQKAASEATPAGDSLPASNG